MLLHSDALDRALGGEEPLQQFGASNSATSGHGRSNAPPASRDLRIAIPKHVYTRAAAAAAPRAAQIKRARTGKHMYMQYNYSTYIIIH